MSRWTTTLITLITLFKNDFLWFIMVHNKYELNGIQNSEFRDIQKGYKSIK